MTKAQLPPFPAPLPADWPTRLAGYAATRDSIGESGAIIHRLAAPGRPTLYLKQGSGTVARDIADEYARLRWLQGRLPVARLVAFAEEGGTAWLLTEALAGQAAYAWLEAHPERRAEAVAGLARFLRRLHALPAETCPFNAALPLRLAAARARIDAGLVETEEFDEVRAGWSAEQVWDRLHALFPVEAAPVVTHGDYSLDNIFLDDSGAVTGIIDVGRLGVADRHQDLAILLNCLGEFDAALAPALFAAYGTTPDPRLIELHLLLDELF
ncbi:APH(3') family aminoglycoside O-phosphotransferase [Sphingomonas sp.]|uniref:APH(3') family aminoglycoside O-phosphotransferase n=1 Tax=Sphingomonas sp. TaxID=28214 RepID=UPI001DF1F5B1|nr:APH(3') family aminoglycoside O-phosphotransferase [Sphingomonas sp.]MBX9796319.1 aminoglycoside 3'-phosphotransferase [Sphingomonas sp.]